MTPINSTLPNRTGLVRQTGENFNNKEAVTNMSKPTTTIKSEKSNNTKSNKNKTVYATNSSLHNTKNLIQPPITSFLATSQSIDYNDNKQSSNPTTFHATSHPTYATSTTNQTNNTLVQQKITHFRPNPPIYPSHNNPITHLTTPVDKCPKITTPNPPSKAQQYKHTPHNIQPAKLSFHLDAARQAIPTVPTKELTQLSSKESSKTSLQRNITQYFRPKIDSERSHIDYIVTHETKTCDNSSTSKSAQ
jgi:hypothetical protein